MKLCATQALRRIGGVVNGCAYGTARKKTRFLLLISTFFIIFARH